MMVCCVECGEGLFHEEEYAPEERGVVCHKWDDEFYCDYCWNDWPEHYNMLESDFNEH